MTCLTMSRMAAVASCKGLEGTTWPNRAKCLAGATRGTRCSQAPLRGLTEGTPREPGIASGAPIDPDCSVQALLVAPPLRRWALPVPEWARPNLNCAELLLSTPLLEEAPVVVGEILAEVYLWQGGPLLFIGQFPCGVFVITSNSPVGSSHLIIIIMYLLGLAPEGYVASPDNLA
jgi:hypothetical protein